MVPKSVFAALTALGVSASALAAKELETTHLFGFTLGSDTNDVGEKEAEELLRAFAPSQPHERADFAQLVGRVFSPFHAAVTAPHELLPVTLECLTPLVQRPDRLRIGSIQLLPAITANVYQAHVS